MISTVIESFSGVPFIPENLWNWSWINHLRSMTMNQTSMHNKKSNCKFYWIVIFQNHNHAKSPPLHMALNTESRYETKPLLYEDNYNYLVNLLRAYLTWGSDEENWARRKGQKWERRRITLFRFLLAGDAKICFELCVSRRSGISELRTPLCQRRWRWLPVDSSPTNQPSNPLINLLLLLSFAFSRILANLKPSFLHLKLSQDQKNSGQFTKDEWFHHLIKCWVTGD